MPEAHYAALTLPRVLARLPYGSQGTQVEEFPLEEFADGAEHGKYLWMSAAWAYARCVTTAFVKDGWLYHTRGIEGGGKMEGLPLHAAATTDSDAALSCSTEVAINERREFELGALGFLPLMHCRDTEFAAFFSAGSCAKPKQYHDPEATANAFAATQLNLTLCAAQFVRCLTLLPMYKSVMPRARNIHWDAADYERLLNQWISAYVVTNPENALQAASAHFPLREARIEVRQLPAKPGWYDWMVWFQLAVWLRLNDPVDPLPPLLKLVAEAPA